jgi:hypothetical protein
MAMKFLVISRPHGGGHDAGSHPAVAREFADQLRKMIDDGTLEAAYAFIGGGSAYVISADSTVELAHKVRGNPVFSAGTHEVIPIADAHDFLDGVAEVLS